LVRYGIRRILVDGLKSVSVGETSDGTRALASIRTDEWDIVVLDVTLPGASGLDVLKDIRRDYPSPAGARAGHAPGRAVSRGARSPPGASGSLTQDSAPTELVNAIEEIRRGGRYLGARRTGQAPAPSRGAELAHDALSDRECQVLRMLGSGKTVSEIAAALGLNVKTVSTYRIRLLGKVHMRGNAELMRYAIENRLVDS
jgi:two-component system invasion response regulator UvrY